MSHQIGRVRRSEHRPALWTLFSGPPLGVHGITVRHGRNVVGIAEFGAVPFALHQVAARLGWQDLFRTTALERRIAPQRSILGSVPN